MMRRREFIGLVGGAAAAWPLAAHAQQKVPTIGFLGAATASVWGTWTAAFVQRLRELGWTEGRAIAIEYRWAEGRPERYAEIAAEFVRLKVDVIVAAGSAVPAVKQATSVIPIVFALASDPVGAGLVANLSQPGGDAPDCRTSGPTLRANGSNTCARFSQICADWRSWRTSAIPSPCWKWARFKPEPAISASKSPN